MGLRDRLVDVAVSYLLGMLLTMVILGIAKAFSLAYQFVVGGVKDLSAVVGYLVASAVVAAPIYVLLTLGDEDGGEEG